MLAVLVAVATSVPYLGCVAVAAEQGVPRQTLVLFPLEASAAMTNQQVVSELNAFLAKGLGAGSRFEVVEYNERLPAVERMLAMQPDKRTLAAGPFAGDPVAVGRAVSLAKAMNADLLLVGLVESYVFNDQEGAAEVKLALQVVDPETGRDTMQPLHITGRGTKPSATAAMGEAAIASEAVKDAGRKIIFELTGEEYRDVPGPVVVREKKTSKQSWIPILLLSLGVGLLLGSSGGDGGGDSNGDSLDPPPPIPF